MKYLLREFAPSGGVVLINGEPVISSIVADASQVRITTGKKGRVTLHVGNRELGISGNADITIDHLCDPIPSAAFSFKLMRGWIFAKIAILVGAEAAADLFLFDRNWT